jgi:anti-sigma regulatory factor (Ser/Thr protein kinase)
VRTERRFDDTGASVGRSRRFVASVTEDAPPEVREAILLMVSELATNAVVHAGGGFVVRVERVDGSIRVTVTDGGSGRPVVQHPDEHQPHGRGLRIVDELSDEWGSEDTAAHGKAVWFRIDAAPLTDRAGGSSGTRSSVGRVADPAAARDGDRGQRLRSLFRVAS